MAFLDLPYTRHLKAAHYDDKRSEAFKAKIVDMVINGGCTYSQVAAEMGCSRGTIAGILTRYRKANNIVPPKPLFEKGPMPEPEHVGKYAILSLKRCSCRWPLGDPKDPDFRFCLKTVNRGQYCAEHTEAAYNFPRETSA